MSIQFLRFRVILPKLRCCVSPGVDRCFKVSKISYYRVPTRSYMNRTSEKYQEKLRIRDMVPEGWSLVYRGGMDRYIHFAKIGSTLLIIVALAGLSGFVLDDEQVVTFPMEMGKIIPLIGAKSYTEVIIMYGTSFLMIYMLRYISNAYVLRMYYNAKTRTYKAIKVGYLPMATSAHDFQAGTLARILKKHYLPWRNIEYKSNGKKLLIFEHGFRTNADYDRMFPDGTHDIENDEDNEDLTKYSN